MPRYDIGPAADATTVVTVSATTSGWTKEQRGEQLRGDTYGTPKMRVSGTGGWSWAKFKVVEGTGARAKTYSLWNPATKRFLSLPTPAGSDEGHNYIITYAGGFRRGPRAITT